MEDKDNIKHLALSSVENSSAALPGVLLHPHRPKAGSKQFKRAVKLASREAYERTVALGQYRPGFKRRGGSESSDDAIAQAGACRYASLGLLYVFSDTTFLAGEREIL
jgi:hypothetical protein